jgi:hypothetical protein
MASSDKFVLRVICRKGENTDWRVPCQIAFRDVLVSPIINIIIALLFKNIIYSL